MENDIVNETQDNTFDFRKQPIFNKLENVACARRLRGRRTGCTTSGLSTSNLNWGVVVRHSFCFPFFSMVFSLIYFGNTFSSSVFLFLAFLCFSISYLSLFLLDYLLD